MYVNYRECFKHELDKAFNQKYNTECYKPPRISNPERVQQLLEVKSLKIHQIILKKKKVQKVV